MRVLVVHAHPVADSYNAALHRTVVETLIAGGHAVDDLDLYASGFDPVLGADEWRGYRDLSVNRLTVGEHVSRLEAADAMVLVYPVWNFGFPAILKGWFDRVFLPGVAFRLEDGRVRPALTNIRRLAAVTTYGGPRLRALLAGDPPRRLVTRVLRATMGLPPTAYLALYDMNRASDRARADFLQRTARAMAGFGG
jgi:putative NADPH-quinone reductase